MPQNIVGGKYKLNKCLGKGGQGNVYLAYDIKLDKYWAVKRCQKIDSFYINELSFLKVFDHPGLPRVVDFFEDNLYGYIVFDYFEGINLKEYIESNKIIDIDIAVDWLIQICDILEYLHNLKDEPIIYRDLKPSNIMLTKRGYIKLIDFGASREFNSKGDDDTVYVGTKGYAAPEQYGIGQTSVKSDIYSFGITAYHLLTGEHPGLNTINTLNLTGNKKISPYLARIIIKCIKRDPEERYETITQVKKHLIKSKTINKEDKSKINYKISKSIKKEKTITISVIGASSGLGVTHTSILLSTFLNKLGKKVAVIEHNCGDTFNMLNNEIDNNSKDNNKFQILGVDYYKNTCSKLYDEYDFSGYQAIIYDMGTLSRCINTSLINQSDLVYVVSSGIEWRYKEIQDCICALLEIVDSNKIYALIPFLDKSQLQLIKRITKGVNVLSIPFHSNPFEIKKKEQKIIKNTFKNLIKRL